MNSRKKQAAENKSVRVPVPDELYGLAREAAQKAGISTEEFLFRALREKLCGVSAAYESHAAT